MNFQGVIIEESLGDRNVLRNMRILSTKIEPVTEKYKTPWVSQWTLHTVQIPPDEIDAVAKRISWSLDKEHAWYADFKNDSVHYIVFRNKVFKVDRADRSQYDEATRYGVSVGIPEYQVDFSPHVKEWKR